MNASRALSRRSTGYVLRRSAFVLAVLAGLAAAAGCTLGRSPAETSSSATEEEERPNVLLLAVDDLRPLIGAYAEGPPTNASGTGGAGAGPPPAPTPHIDALAADGTLFQRAFTHYAVCAPSRATLLTGMRPDSLDMWVNQVPVRELVPGVVTLPQYFRQNGYYTASIGFKTFHNPDPPSWDERVKVDIRKNKDRIGPGRYYDPQAIAAMKKPGGGRQRGPTYEHPEVPDTAYTDGEAAGRAVGALRRVSEERPEQPFFMSVGFLRPHLPFNCPDRYWEAAGEETQKLPDNYFEPKNVTKFSLSNFGELRSYAGIPDEGPVPKEIGRGMNRAYRACVSYVDAQIGRVMDALRAQGMAENTIVVLWGDHGFKLGEHKSWSKHTVYEIDTRVPLIVRTPEGLPGAAPGEGQYTDALVETVDVYPTLAQLAGLPVPRQPQGISFVPLLENPDRPWKEAAFMQYGRGAGQSIGVMGRAIRTDRYRYVEWQREPGQPQGKLEAGGEVLARELYDHRSDPAENVNVVGQAEYAETVERLSRMLNEGRKQALPEGVEPSR